MDVALSSTMTRKRSGPHGNVPNDSTIISGNKLLRRALLMEINAAKADFEVWKCKLPLVKWLGGLLLSLENVPEIELFMGMIYIYIYGI